MNRKAKVKITKILDLRAKCLHFYVGIHKTFHTNAPQSQSPCYAVQNPQKPSGVIYLGIYVSKEK